MFKSFDNVKMTSNIVNIDLEEISFCLAHALIVHIKYGD